MNRPFRAGQITKSQAEILNRMYTNTVRVKFGPYFQEGLDLAGGTQRVTLDIKALRDALIGSGSGSGATGSGGGSGSGSGGSGSGSSSGGSGSGSGSSGGSGSGSGATNWTSANAYAFSTTVVEQVCPTYTTDNSIWNTDSFGGDVSGIASNLSVIRLRGQPISSTTPTSGQALIFDGTNWTPTTLSNGVPTGTVVAFINTVQSGYLELVGGNVSRTTYSALFSYVGTLYGNGDGSTTFGLPDARGRTIIGAGTGSGLTLRTLAATLGVENVSLTGVQNGSHTHGPSAGFTAFWLWNPAGPTTMAAGASWNMQAAGNTATASSGSGTAHENMQPSIVFRWAVKT